jgi:hypothetical protein
MSVGGAGEARVIAQRSAVAQEEAGFTGKRKDGTGKLRKGRKPIARQRIAVATS